MKTIRDLIEQAHRDVSPNELRPTPGLPSTSTSAELWSLANQYDKAGLHIAITLDGAPCIRLEHFRDLDVALTNEQDRADALSRRSESASRLVTCLACAFVVTFLWAIFSTVLYLSKGA